MQFSYRATAAVIGALLLAQAPGLPARAAPAQHSTIAFTRQNNVFLMNDSGGGVQTVTTRGTGYAGIYYPWYQWSPDGKYLLLLRSTYSSAHYTILRDLLLLSADGTLLRTLASGLPQGDFEPSWALDADRIIYVSGQSSGSKGFLNTVATMDLSGTSRTAWSYASIEGCGGGTGIPSQQLLNEEVGFGDLRFTMQWSTARHLAVYSASCAGGLNVTDTSAGKTQRLGPSGRTVWNEAALSRRGTLAINVTEPSGLRAIAITDPIPGAATTGVAPGEHPMWSPDGSTLYFVQRTALKQLHFTDALGNSFAAPFYSTSLLRARADGSVVTRLLTTDAYGFGYPSIAGDGKTLYYSSVDNMTALAAHSAANGRYTDAILRQYGPRVRILRYTIGGKATTLALQAGRPAAQP